MLVKDFNYKSQEDDTVNENSNHHSETENGNSAKRVQKHERKRKEFPGMIIVRGCSNGDDEINEPAEFNKSCRCRCDEEGEYE
jgi:hypothetical protein